MGVGLHLSLYQQGEKNEGFNERSCLFNNYWLCPCSDEFFVAPGSEDTVTHDETSSLISWSFWCGEDACVSFAQVRGCATLHHVLLRGGHEKGEHGGKQARCGPCSLGSWLIEAKRTPVHSTISITQLLFFRYCIRCGKHRNEKDSTTLQEQIKESKSEDRHLDECKLVNEKL